ncbi:MAG: hypothetical protein ABI947_03860 [Chloroflexota bacterium]
MPQLTTTLAHNRDSSFTLTGCLKWFVGLLALLLGLYLAYAVLLWVQFSSNHAKWLNSNVASYTVMVKYGSSNAGNYADGSEVVRNGQVIQGHYEFDKPIIDWAFEHAQTCISEWLVCMLFRWSFQFDPIYGYPTHIEYHDYDWLYTIDVSGFTKTVP